MRIRRDDRTGLPPLVRIVGGLVGAAVFGAGVAAVFTTTNGTGAAALLVIGAGFVLLAVLGDRLQSLEFGGINLSLKDVARQALALAGEEEQAGNFEKAKQLRAVAKELQQLASDYRSVRRRIPAGQERTRVFNELIARTRTLAKSSDLDANDVLRWFDEGSPEARVTALGLMEGNEELRNFDAALDAIEPSQSAYEQYHGLVLAAD